MIKLDNAFLVDLGFGELPASHRKALLQIIYEELEMRVGLRIARGMTKAQLVRFRTFVKAKDHAAALAWLNAEQPNYRDIVAAEFDLLRTEINAHREDIQILSSAYAEIAIELPTRVRSFDKGPKVSDEEPPPV